MERFRQYQRSAFEQITAEWPAGERLEFARLMVKYVESQDALRTRVRRTPADTRADPPAPGDPGVVRFDASV